MRTLTGVPREGVSNDSGVVDDGNFSVIGDYFSQTSEIRTVLLYGVCSLWSRNVWPWMTLQWHH